MAGKIVVVPPITTEGAEKLQGASLAADDLRDVLRVNADVIHAILADAGVDEAAYLAVRIANELDPPNNPKWEPRQVARLYLALDGQDGLTHEAMRRVAEFKAAAAIGMERAAKICADRAAERADQALNGLPEQARLHEAMEAAATGCATAILNARLQKTVGDA